MVSSNKSVLVLGAAGFLGSAVSRYFIEQGMAVHGADIVSPVRSIPFASFELVEDSPTGIAKVLSAVRPAYLLNFAGSADVGRSLVSPENDFRRSVGLVFSWLEGVRLFSPDTRVLLASSAAVYGQPNRLPIDEEMLPRPLSPYGYHKWMCELLAKEYCEVYGIGTASTRIFSAYGTGLRKQILWDLCCKCQAGGSIELGGDGSETRDFIHADDVAQAVGLILGAGKFAGESYNVANGTETTIADLAGRVVSEFRLPLDRLQFSGAGRLGDPKNWRADIGRLRALGYSPKVVFAQGVADYVKWFQRQ
jgi:UDP-glucose 4-epimerase